MNEIIAAILGAITTKVVEIAVDLYRDRLSNIPTNTIKERGNWPNGRQITIQELRILHALLGEDGGRFISHYRNDIYYKSSLEDLVNRKLVKLSDDKYYLTDEGYKYIFWYLIWLRKSWKPKN